MDMESEKMHQDWSRGEDGDKRCFSGNLIEATGDISLWEIGWHYIRPQKGETEWHSESWKWNFL